MNQVNAIFILRFYSLQVEKIEIDFENGEHYDVTIGQNGVDNENEISKEAEIEGDGFLHPDWVKAKVFTFNPEQIERAQALAQELEKDVKEEEKKPVHPVSLVKLGIGCGAFLMFFILFPLFVCGMRKVVKQVREWRKLTFYQHFSENLTSLIDTSINTYFRSNCILTTFLISFNSYRFSYNYNKY